METKNELEIVLKEINLSHGDCISQRHIQCFYRQNSSVCLIRNTYINAIYIYMHM